MYHLCGSRRGCEGGVFGAIIEVAMAIVAIQTIAKEDLFNEEDVAALIAIASQNTTTT
jgi:hypothetical protein